MISKEAMDMLTQIAATIGTGGVVFLLLVLWSVNRERIQAQQQLLQLAVKGVEVFTGTTNAITALQRSNDDLRKEVRRQSDLIRQRNRGSR